MANKKKERYFMADFETTVYDGQEYTEVWAAACVEFFTEDVHLYHSIGDFYDSLKAYDGNLIVYFHNLKFDGTFIIDYLINTLHMPQAFDELGFKESPVYRRQKRKEMNGGSFNYIISSRGQWYSIIIKQNHRFIEFRDSLKILPFSIEEIGKSFDTKHKKLGMEYKGFRYAGCPISEEEAKYIKNDVLCPKEALELMLSQGHNQMTIGSNCLQEFKNMIGDYYYKEWFLNLEEWNLDKNIYGCENADQYIRKSYKGGWCYLKHGCENTVYHEGVTADVNSLYPSMMHSESGNRFPVGKPHFWTGNIPDDAIIGNRYFFVRIRTSFDLKENHLPCIQIKGNWNYRPTEWLTTSRLEYEGEWYDEWEDPDGNIIPTTVTMTLTQTDFMLITDHYHLYDFEVLDGCWFDTEIGIFDKYIDKWKEIKVTSTGAMRTLAKLFLNYLYGKMASSSDSSFKICYVNDAGGISYLDQQENEKTVGYIPIGSAITSYARNFTIRTAQKNYENFIYADTDSIHCNCKQEDLVGVPVHPTDFCKWKLESCWDEAIFVRQKTYIEHVTHKDLVPLERLGKKPYYDVKCAGMPTRCKEYFLEHMNSIVDFKIGLVVPGKLVPRRIKGGTLLVETTYEMR